MGVYLINIKELSNETVMTITEGDSKQSQKIYNLLQTNKNITIKCVDRNDMVVSFYQRDNEVYCYVRDISNINPSQSDRSRALFTQGHRMTQQSGDLPAKLCKEIMHIPGTYRAWIAPIVNSAYNINDHSKKNSITNLIKILTDIYPEKELDKYSNN